MDDPRLKWVESRYQNIGGRRSEGFGGEVMLRDVGVSSEDLDA